MDYLKGDENTNYFHSIIKRRYSKRNIRGLNINGVWCEDPFEIKNATFEHYQKLFRRQNSNTLRLKAETVQSDTPITQLTPQQATDIEKKITEAEILDAINECSASKAPVPDGFKFSFYKMHWGLFKDYLVKALNWFWDKCEISNGCNASFITLVPKSSDPLELNEFRPISLIGSYYKILAKVLSNRIRKVIPNLIGIEQNAFIKGRYILDGALIANEAIDFLKKNKKKSLIFEVDFEKAFDSLSWDFLLTLVKSVLSSLPLYYFSLFRAPLCVIKRLESIRRNFFWGGSGESKKLIWIKWADSLLPFGEGGLNIGSLRAKNLALLGKWIWRVKTEPNSLWVKILKSIYGSNELLLPSCLNRSQEGSGVWCNILRPGHDIEKLGINFSNSFLKQIGNGVDTAFWFDPWLGDKPLKTVFGRLYRLETNQDALVNDIISWAGSVWQANWSWSRDPFGRASGELQELTSLINSYPKLDKLVDSWQWKLASNGIFSTSKLSRIIDDILLQDGRTRQATTRHNLVPLKVEVFMWRVLNMRIPVLTELDKRGIDLDSVRCPLCDDDIESIDHSMIFCRLTMDIWERLYKWWNLGPVSNLSSNEAFRGKCIRNLSPSGTRIWQATEWTCAYLIWRNRNQKVFSNKSWITSTALMEIQLKSFEWIASRFKKEKIEWLEWLTNPIKFCV
ncbi:uncharacterized protein [Rutidosis leptorrhynchoides]|uniref:uncharacterized protein n=1 Tax=Rutidosis leptorrhynchoides TaxID=125765 RepID=UPI003A998D24